MVGKKTKRKFVGKNVEKREIEENSIKVKKDQRKHEEEGVKKKPMFKG